MNIIQVITKETKNQLNRNAVIDGDKIITYGQLFEEVNKTSHQLKKIGVARFNRVALFCEDSIDYMIMSLAVLKLYAVMVPVPFGSTQDEVNALLKDLNVNFLIFEQGSYPQKKAQAVGEKLFIANLKNKNRVAADFYKINPAFIRFSSGTTGKNKGVVLSHKSIIYRTAAANRGLKINPGEQIIWVLSMSFHFVVTILLFLRRGATIILSSRNFPQELLHNLNLYPPTFIYASPLHYHLLTSLNVSKKSLSKVRLAISTAIKLPAQIAEKFSRKFGFQLAESYGIIEIGMPFTNTSGKLPQRGSVGKILPDYKIKILNPDEQGIGSIYIKGKGMFDAYFRPWRSRQKVSPGGWFNTGDLGRLDQKGFLFILGRHKQLINFSGMKIFPFEIESLLNRHPLVKESLVYGLKHPEYGQLPAAKIVLKNPIALIKSLARGKPTPNQTTNRLAEILSKFCYRHLTAYKVPKKFEFVNYLPKTVSGKLKIVV